MIRHRKTNIYLRDQIKKLGLYNWEAAKILGFSETWFCVLLREEIPLEEQVKIVEQIREGVKDYLKV